MSDISFLPTDFINRMEQDLGPDFHAFLRSYEQDKISALRLNPLKSNALTIEQLDDILLDKVEWCPNGYYYSDEKRPGLHPYHAAGVFYIQDASAQLPVEMLSPEPGDYVLDMCAAPGGKSTQIAGKLLGQGLLVCNEPMKPRAKILSENIERLGVRNAVVTSEFPDKLAEHFENYFDKILIDAPCSGEGMFRKNHDACNEWSLESVEMCAKRQSDILDRGYELLIPGGMLCYSTCTFSKAEDEECITAFLKRHSDMELIEQRRLWPHEIKGEGHFAALLHKKDLDACADELRSLRGKIPQQKIDKQILKQYLIFTEEALDTDFQGQLFLNGDNMYMLPQGCIDFNGLHVLRAGIHVGTFKKNRFEPAHSLALALKEDEVKSKINFTKDSKEISDYLHGQSLFADIDDGWCLITVDGYSVGWGKAVKGQIKNHYPKGLRTLG